MAHVKRADAPRASPPASPKSKEKDSVDSVPLADFEAELKRLSAVNKELLDGFHVQSAPQACPTISSAMGLEPADPEQLELLRLENAVLKSRIAELEAGKGEAAWLERQREYEMLLEEKSEVIRGLHQKLQESQEAQESAINAADNAPAPGGSSVSCSGSKLGQAEEILRLKREMEEQRRQLEQDEEDMMGQMRQMELTMAKERAEMARQRQEVQRLQAELTRAQEQSSRDPELKERLNSLRRNQDAKQGAAAAEGAKTDQKSSGFFRRIFG
jgi:hypothetical protein